MMGDSQEYKVFIEELGTLSPGYVKLSGSSIQFKNDKTGKVTTMKTDEIEDLNWQRLGNKPGIKLCMQDGGRFRFGGFKDSDYEKVKAFATRHWSKDLEQKELVLKGWNYGDCEVKGQSIEFKSDGRPVFDVPLANVSNCMTNKSEATLEFHQNDDCRTLLMEMRFHIPANEDDDTDPVEEFRKAVLAYAGVESETGQPIASLSQILCTTPRGRYDIKVFPNHLSLHGKTYDYKISIKTIMRLFLVPHKDGRHVYFVISLNPPIKQGQTRYHYLVLEFLKEEEIDLELGLTPEQLKDQYNGKLEKEISGQLYEVVSKIFRVLINMKITVPGNFLGHSGTPAVSCAHKQASGFLYPLEKGFLYIHKPPMYIRFEEVSSVHFARSDVSTRSFDFEIELKSGVSLVFNSIEKEEYNKLYDYVQNKHLRIRNARVADKDQATDRFAGSDEELDPYKEAVMAEGKVRAGDDSESDSEDEDYDLDEDLKKRHEDKPSDEGSGSEPDEEFDSDAGTSDSDGGESGDDDADEPKKKKEKKEKKEKKDKESKEPKERKKREKKAGKKEKDPNAPKRNQSAFMLWLNESRSKIKKEGDSVADVAKKAGELWKSLSEGDKEPFEKQAAEDKERYEREKKEYEDSGAAKAFVASSSKSSGEAKKEKKSPKKATGPSPSKAKSKEYISDSDSDDDEDDKPLRPPKKEKESKKEDKKDAKKEVKKEVKKESSEEESDDDASDSD